MEKKNLKYSINPSSLWIKKFPSKEKFNHKNSRRKAYVYDEKQEFTGKKNRSFFVKLCYCMLLWRAKNYESGLIPEDIILGTPSVLKKW